MFLYIKKAPQKCGAVTKTQNIDMKKGHRGVMTVTVNILAFFIVVASSQISPHFPFRAAKIVKISDIQMDRMYFVV
jgi:hypothetical protein